MSASDPFLDKLRRTVRADAPARGAAGLPAAELLGLRRRLQPTDLRVPLPEGREVQRGGGSFWLREVSYPLAHRHGRWPLGALLAVASEPLAVLAGDDTLRGVDLTRAVFLDTETTGLAGGAGTVVFLTGLGLVEGDRFVVRQVFLRAFADEPAALAYVAETCAQASALVTFFGKSFDRHRLADRLLLHRMPALLRQQRHLDLYWLHRRVHLAAHGRALPDGKLKTAERSVLGVQRDDDLPGALCPLEYLDWLRAGSGRIDKIFAHNLLDVLSLVTLTCELARDPLAAADPRLCLAHGHRLYRAAPDRAAALFAAAGAADLAAKAQRRAARQQARGGSVDAVGSSPAPTAPTPPAPAPGTSPA